jgi:hypothetical protein
VTTTVPFTDAVAAGVHGYELRLIQDLRDILEEAKAGFQTSLDVAGAVQCEQALQRIDLLCQMIPRARFVLWKRDENFITVSQTVESLRSEFPWLKREKVSK